jgi:hypothetical protein
MDTRNSADRENDRSADFLGLKFDPESERSMNLRLVVVGAVLLLVGVVWGLVAQQFEWSKLRSECNKVDIPHLEPFDHVAACACAVEDAKKEYSFMEFFNVPVGRGIVVDGPDAAKAKTVVTDAVFTCVRRSRNSDK